MARAPMVMPSKTRSAYSLRISRSLKVPGSPSSALQTMYLGPACLGRGEVPLHGRGEPRAPPPLQLGITHGIDDVGARHRQGLGQALARRDAFEGQLVGPRLEGRIDAHRAPSVTRSATWSAARTRYSSTISAHTGGGEAPYRPRRSPAWPDRGRTCPCSWSTAG